MKKIILRLIYFPYAITVFVLTIIIGAILMFPYWVLTGEITWSSNTHDAIIDHLDNLHEYISK